MSKRNRSKDSPKTAAQLMAELQADPEFVSRAQAAEEQLATNARQYAAAAADLLNLLRMQGFDVQSVGDLRRLDSSSAIPLLVEWLPRVSYHPLKEDIIRTLSVPAAKPLAAQALVTELTQTEDSGLRWALANALSVVGDDSVFDDVRRLILDKSLGSARQMLTLALANMKTQAAVDLLIALLADEEVVGHAVMALGKLKPPGLRAELEPLMAHETEWVREEAGKVIAKLPDKNATDDPEV